MKYVIMLMLLIGLFACSDDGSLGSGNSTLSGSYANMLVVGDFLYAVSDSELITYDRSSQPDSLIEIGRKNLDFGVESLLYRKGLLFIGSITGMYIYEIASDGLPFRKSVTHYTIEFDVVPCDPIAVNDTMAIVSLSTQLQGPCDRLQSVNELRFYNITDLESPVLVNSWEMNRPKGIAIDDQYLFVCEAALGLRVYDISSIEQPDLVYSYDGIETFDVIATGELLILVGPNSLYEFDYSNINDIQLLSTIDI